MGPRTNEYSGQTFVLLRDKNRFVLPTQIRKALKEANAREEGNRTFMYLAVHDEWDCLIGFGLDYKDDLANQIRLDEELARSAGRDFNRQKRALEVSSYERVPFDGGGRFVVPENLAGPVGLENRCFFMGGTDFFLIWHPPILYAMDDSWRRAKDNCRRQEEREMAKAGRK